MSSLKIFKSKLEKGVKNLQNKEKNYLKKKKIIQQKKIISAEEYKKEVSSLRKKFHHKRKKYFTRIQAKQRSKARKELAKSLNPIIKDYMKEKIRMVVDRKSLLMADENLTTKDIMSILNKNLKSIKLD